MVSAFSLHAFSVLSIMMRRSNGGLPDAEMKLSMSSELSPNFGDGRAGQAAAVMG
jgi:hypothetical protein